MNELITRNWDLQALMQSNDTWLLKRSRDYINGRECTMHDACSLRNGLRCLSIAWRDEVDDCGSWSTDRGDMTTDEGILPLHNQLKFICHVSHQAICI